VARQQAKYRLLANLLGRELPDQELRRWYRLIDWIMKLPEEANRAVWLRLRELQEPTTMSHVTYAEIFGRQEGFKEGRSEGLKEGRSEGLKEGRSEGLKDSLREALDAKFPEEASTLFAELQSGEPDIDRLKALLRAAVLAVSPDDFRKRIASAG
jgi:flagellar biosynthesis/type III secretory pathway protein FliH